MFGTEIYIKTAARQMKEQNNLNRDRQHDSSTLVEEQRRTSWRFRCLLRLGVPRCCISEIPSLLATQMGDVKTVFAEVFSRCLETAWSKWLQDKLIFQELEHMEKNHMILGRCFQVCLSEIVEDWRLANLPHWEFSNETCSTFKKHWEHAFRFPSTF